MLLSFYIFYKKEQFGSYSCFMNHVFPHFLSSQKPADLALEQNIDSKKNLAIISVHKRNLYNPDNFHRISNLVQHYAFIIGKENDGQKQALSIKVKNVLCCLCDPLATDLLIYSFLMLEFFADSDNHLFCMKKKDNLEIFTNIFFLL